MTRTSRLVLLLVTLMQGLFFLHVSQHRLIDGDEGFYLLASRLVMQHRTPYLDFFYTQAPLLPYAFAGWLKLAGVSWYSARAFCALLTTIVGMMIYRHVSRETGQWLAGVCAVLLFATSSLVFAWFPIVKTFPLAMVFLFPAYMIFAGLSPSTPRWQIALAGVLFGLASDTRSYVVALLPVFAWWLWRKYRSGSLVSMIWFSGGVIVGAIPSLVLFVASPSAFLFNNLGYHALRSDAGLIGDFHDKMMIAAATIGGAYTGFQFTVTTLTALVLVIVVRPRRDSSLLALVMAIVLGLISLLPTPASIQYFSMLMPFLIVAAVCAVNDFLAGLRSPTTLRLVGTACIVLVVAYVGFGASVLRQYLSTGFKVPGVSGVADAHNWTLPEVTAVSQAVNELAKPGEPVASFWPGYLFATWADPLPGYENDFGLYVAQYLTPEKRQQYHILTPGEMAKGFADHDARLVVIGNQGPSSGGPDVRRAQHAMETYDYRLVKKVGDTLFYECCSR